MVYCLFGVLILFFLCFLLTAFENMSIGNVSEIITASVATMALFLSIIEYEKYKTAERYATLAEYNKRYSSDQYIISCLNYLTSHLYNEDRNLPTIVERELFIRYFEELQVQVNSGRLNKDKVQELFAYYGIVAFLDPSFSENIIEFDSEDEKISNNSKNVWNNYYLFLKNNRDFAKEIWNERTQTYGANLSEQKYKYILTLE